MITKQIHNTIVVIILILWQVLICQQCQKEMYYYNVNIITTMYHRYSKRKAWLKLELDGCGLEIGYVSKKSHSHPKLSRSL